ncbi:ABC-F family ATP-binding cassette domain-containing protein [Streptomyces capparidis]
MPAQLSFHGVSKSYGDRPLLDGVSFTVRPGERVGVVGENGAGKSTLLRLLAGTETPDDGEVVAVADGGIGHLTQTPELPPDRTVQDAVNAALAEVRAMERRLRALEPRLAAGSEAELAEYGELLTRFELRGGYEADARVDKAVHALGLAGVGRERALGSLSGGEQARLGLACLLAAAPEVMLLDEPTNHLDGAALTWLEDQLRAHRGTVVAVSHDRVFLERVATVILEVDADRRAVARHGGGYADWLADKAAARRRWEQEYRAWCEEVEELTVFASATAHRVAQGRVMKDRNKVAYDRDRGRVQSSVSSRVRNARERLRRLREDPVPRPPDPLRFSAGLSGPGGGGGAGEGGEVVSLSGVRVGDRLSVDALALRAGDRLLVHGPNGAGKSTLLRVLAGELAPDEGTVRRHGRVGLLRQETPVTAPERSLLAAFAGTLGCHPRDAAEPLLSFGLFRPEDLRVPVGSLSAGQRRRLALAGLLAREVDLLLLDEPTNHLSPVLVEELEQALADYRGVLVLVTHDRRLRQRFAGARLELRAGRAVARPATGREPCGPRG